MGETGHGGDAELRERLTALAEPAAATGGVELVDVEVRGQRGRRLVRVVVDADGGVDVERLTLLSRAIGDRFDADDVVEGRYTLEVTSPGVDRPMRTPRDFARNLGRPVRITRTDGDPRELEGVLQAVDDDAVVVGTGDDDVRVPLASVERGRVVLPW